MLLPVGELCWGVWTGCCFAITDDAAFVLHRNRQPDLNNALTGLPLVTARTPQKIDRDSTRSQS